MHGVMRLVNRSLLQRAMASGSAASLLSSAVLAVCSKREQHSAAAGMNGPSQWLWGERQAYTRRASLKHTLPGYLIHHATSTFWALLYETLTSGRRRKTPVRVLSEAAALAAAAYVVDYKLTPRRLRPGFEKHIGPGSMFSVYASFAVGLAAATLLRRRAPARGGGT